MIFESKIGWNSVRTCLNLQKLTLFIRNSFPWTKRFFLGFKKLLNDPQHNIDTGSKADKTITQPFTDSNPGYNPDIHPFIFLYSIESHVWRTRSLRTADTKPIPIEASLYNSSKLSQLGRACDTRTMTGKIYDHLNKCPSSKSKVCF